MLILGKNVTIMTVIAGILALLAVCWWSWRHFSQSLSQVSKASSRIIVEKHSFSLQIVERGIIRPAKIFPISSQISSNQSKIVWLVKEGAQVGKGMLVARFDTKPFADNLQKAEQAFADAQATYLASEKVLTLQKEEESGKVEEATRKLTIAKIQADNTRDGSGPLKRKTLQQQVHQAERILEICRNELSDMNVLLEKGHVSARERDKAADKLATATEQVAVAAAELENFKAYVWPQMQREAELLVGGAESNLERVKRTGELLIQNRAAEVEKYRRDVQNKKTALENAKMEIVNCDLYAPSDGVLLYPELPRENGRRKIQIGDSVWVGQTFLEVPDTSELIAELLVREVDVSLIGPGMKTEIEVDAFPGRLFAGSVESVASLAKEDEENSHVRRFYTRVRLTGDTDKIHVGMSVTAKIIYKEVNEVIAIPHSAVLYRDKQPMVRRAKGDAYEDMPIVLGEKGPLWVEVIGTLQVGDLLYTVGQ